MKLRWLGHACFKLTTDAGTTVVIDPYDDSVGYGTLNTSADVVITSHAHHDHSNVDAVSGCSLRIDRAGKYTYQDVTILTTESFHDDCGGAKRGRNLLTCVLADGQSVVHLGDLGHEPDAQQLAFIERADVLLIPVGGFFTIDTPTAIRIVRRAKPKAVVPMHYKAAGNEYPISTVDEFAEKTNARKAEAAENEIGALTGAVILPL